jgi:hypothetical protein
LISGSGFPDFQISTKFHFFDEIPSRGVFQKKRKKSSKIKKVFSKKKSNNNDIQNTHVER